MPDSVNTPGAELVEAVEAVARAIDPAAWHRAEYYLATQHPMRQFNADEEVRPSLAKARAAIAVCVERCAFAARDALVDHEWPPQDGDKQINDVMSAIRSLATEAGR